jgi:hypothetical protein
MDSKIHRRIALLAAAGVIGGGLVGTAFVGAASATDNGPVCTAYEGKYEPRLVTSYPINGGNDSRQGVPGGTLQLWASGTRAGRAPTRRSPWMKPQWTSSRGTETSLPGDTRNRRPAGPGAGVPGMRHRRAA